MKIIKIIIRIKIKTFKSCSQCRFMKSSNKQIMVYVKVKKMFRFNNQTSKTMYKASLKDKVV